MQYSNLFSVIINCHNGEKFLQQTFDSLWAQNFKNFEVIYWDNNSTDKSLEIAQAQGKKNLRCFQNKKYSILGEARYLALQHAKGKWVCFLDSDDIWHPDKLLQDSLIIKENQKVGLIYSNFHTIDENNNILSKDAKCEKRLRNGKKYSHLVKDNVIGLLTTSIKKEEILKINDRYRKYQIREDGAIFYQLVKNTSVYCHTKSYASYRVHESNIAKDRISSLKEGIFLYYNEGLINNFLFLKLLLKLISLKLKIRINNYRTNKDFIHIPNDFEFFEYNKFIFS